ncbi:uncharacterized protein LOC122628074 [Vespula pensylvanica]|uniref:uncharacterized protein LOC122628074 n=1 Tax=Vespula pensylvanica TaxID=30213 RepID=UPI001CB9EBD9|nr:uncharacterized protein LOC122628074 [Vespula pensylvanica]
MTSMKLSASSQCVKYLMFIFNLFFVMTGIVLLSLGLTIHTIYFNYVHFLDNKFLSIPSLMIAVGIIIFFIAFFGCCGAVRENYCMLIIFTTLLIFIFILEFSGGIAGYVLRSQAGEVIKEKMTNTMQLYNTSKDVAGIWDEIQTEFECCGVTNMTDWEIRFDNSDLPMSCCRPQQGKIGISVCNITVNYVYPDGCLNKFQQYIKSHAVQLGGVGLGIATIQLTGVMIISVGSTIYAVYEDFSHFLDPRYFSPATLLIVVGILVFIIAFFGCCGALRESTCMVLVFAVSLSVVLIMELSAATAAYALQDTVKDLLEEKINHTMHEYDKNTEIKSAVNFMQSRLRCCGYVDMSNWYDIEFTKENDMGIPNSCCDLLGKDDNNKTICNNPYVIGCMSRLSIIVHRSALYIGTGAVAIALIQLTGIVFACMLGRAIRRQKTERERRKWELRESIVNGYQPLGKTDPLTTFPVVYMQSQDYPLKGNTNW